MLITRALIAGAITAALLTPATSATAADVVASGWWTTSPAPVAPPDAEDALVVQGGVQPDQPTSYAAVQFTLEDGESASRLDLTVAPGSVSTPGTTLTVCPLTRPFLAADGGEIAFAPPYDCATSSSATATDGVYTFDVAALAAGRDLALAILPGLASDRVVLSKPGSDALETAGAETPVSSDVVDPETSFGDDTADAGSFAPPVTSSGTFDLPEAPSPAIGSSDAVSPDAPPAGSPGGGTEPEVVDVAPASSTDDGRSMAPLVFLLLAAVAGVLWGTAGRMSGAAEPAEV